MDGVVLVLLLVGVVVLSLWAGVDAALQPDQAYREAGISKPFTSGLIILTCLLGAAIYAAVLRPRLKRAQR